MHISDFDYELPKELIAQTPSEKRDECRLMVVHRKDGSVEHRHFYDIADYLRPTDCLVLNNSKVLPARLYGVKEGTGAKVEFLLIKRLNGDIWETMVRPGKRLKVGDSVSFSSEKLFRATVKDYGEDGTRIVEFQYEGIFMERLEELGEMPLPPYIERENNSEDKDRYQTVYCREEGSVAAPTAGLHFTEELLQKVQEKGVKTAYVTLHVGIGTFRPVKVENIEEHHMHFEEYYVSEEAAKTINDTILAGGRIVSVGTTSTRTVESAAVRDETTGKWLVKAGSGSTGIFIYPGYTFKIINALITNFHLPKSTLLMLVSALYNREEILRVYQIAVDEKYRFFSYGDAMLID
ncbi:MAG: tRNA preQ1(34) S-adenosylmethionine ribosyltransferase-isomerase QueA [Firmicutes bacterium]|nr:tRNA preQ1(34) S-adenosylmethionine ribosyltransferase-isomerase QueA [Bacillota bacterium]MDD7601220.1 tRNA preQ1(34) S-adenosylmethionine ribosyltransferase-isomerase QueA [Bacillota bacterium]MDY5857441.1 tRNA preQ1(34) S-adenosylmethionine ribosyltransferase-isomerase QueA [Anaerovoracaceae bacterium]